MKRFLFVIFAIFLFAGSSFAAEVKNVTAKQTGNRLLFEFDITGDEGETEVNVAITLKGKTYTNKDLHIEGDFGKVKTGKGKKIWWNLLQDFPRGHAGDIEWEITAGGKDFKDPVTGMEFVFVKGGCYQMGDTFGDGDDDEKPVHEVCVDGFYIGKYEVTQAQWRTIMLYNNPSTFKNCDTCPVEQVSWDDVQEFITRLNRNSKVQATSLNQQKGNSPFGKGGQGGFRLPTEAEWEYAARSGGKKEKYSGGNNIGSVTWYDNNSGGKTHPVGQKEANGLGLYDMSGNILEWVQDWYDKNYYRNSPKNNPGGASSGRSRVLRGGSWDIVERYARTTHRLWDYPVNSIRNYGFRVVRTN
ncbi:MAG: formylglycine-generating enzyme family protein [Nitrospinae bacterium]|nr:formylglycine-generating enzyme family protein [Nitrospinota bacterium]